MRRDEHPLFGVNGVRNGVLEHGNMIEDTKYYRRGTGKLPTASAVVADVIDCARHLGKTVMCFWEEDKLELTSIDNSIKKFFVRVDKNNDGDIANIEKVFKHVEIIPFPELPNEFAFVTEAMSEKEYCEKSNQVSGIKSMIRIEE